MYGHLQAGSEVCLDLGPRVVPRDVFHLGQRIWQRYLSRGRFDSVVVMASTLLQCSYPYQRVQVHALVVRYMPESLPELSQAIVRDHDEL